MNKFKAKLCANCLANAELGYAVDYEGYFKTSGSTQYVNGMRVKVMVQRWKKSEDVMKTTKGKDRNYAYCPECAKVLYPNYVKLPTVGFTNPIMKNILSKVSQKDIKIY